jgi:hypothetical protein
MENGRPRGAFFVSALSGLLKAKVPRRVDNIKNQNYFSSGNLRRRKR